MSNRNIVVKCENIVLHSCSNSLTIIEKMFELEVFFVLSYQKMDVYVTFVVAQSLSVRLMSKLISNTYSVRKENI